MDASSTWHLQKFDGSRSFSKCDVYVSHRRWLNRQRKELIERANVSILSEAAKNSRKAAFDLKMDRLRRISTDDELLEFADSLDYETQLNEFEEYLQSNPPNLPLEVEQVHELTVEPIEASDPITSITVEKWKHISVTPQLRNSDQVYTDKICEENVKKWFTQKAETRIVCVIPEFPQIAFDASRLPFLRLCPYIYVHCVVYV